IGGPLPPRSLALGVAVARIGLERDRSELIKAHHHAIRRTRAVQRHDARGLLLERRVGAALPSTGALEGDVLLAQDAPQRLDGNMRHHSAPFEVSLQASQRPVRQRLAKRRWRRQRDGHDPLACGRLKRLRPTSAYFWVQALEAIVIER